MPPKFVQNGSGDIILPLRRKYQLGAPAVNRSNFETYIQKNRALLISKDFAKKHLMGTKDATKDLHLTPLGWAPSKKVAGRPTTE